MAHRATSRKNFSFFGKRSPKATRSRERAGWVKKLDAQAVQRERAEAKARDRVRKREAADRAREERYAKRRADQQNREFLRKAAREEKAKSKEQKLAEALERKYTALQKKSVATRRRMSDKSILADLLRENPDLAVWRRQNPARFDRCVQAVQAKGGAANAYAVCRAALSRKNPSEAAAEAFEEFHGYPSSEIVTVSKRIHTHEHLAAAGRLVAIAIQPVDRSKPVRVIKGFGKNCLLCFNEARNQLFIEGGDQKLDESELKNFGIAEPHELETLGRATGIDYHTTKTHLGDEGGTATYEHGFRTTNERGEHVVLKIARYPHVIYRVLDEQIEFSGGSYTIRAEGIDK
jgi:hypothetical protein